MDRYVVFLWDPAITTHTEQVTRWRSQLGDRISSLFATIDHPGLVGLVLSGVKRSVRLAPLEGLEGCVIGSVFERGNEQAGRVERFGAHVSDSIAQSQGRKLTKDYWGDYTALWRTPGSQTVEVLRDPCGATPCFRTQACGIDILCSHVSDIAPLAGITFSTDWEGVNAFLTSGYFVTRHTGLSELEEILPGQCMTWRPGAEASFAWAWNATELASSPVKQTFAESSAEFRKMAETCMEALTSEYSSIVVRASGGLDSSVVASLAARSCPGRVTALHIVGHGYETYEQNLARLAATHAGIEFVEVEIGGASIDLAGAIGLPRTARPSRQVLSTGADAQLVAACKEVRADCIMTGHGGDALFLQRSLTADAFGDYLRLNCPRPQALQIAYNCASLLEQSIWGVFKRGIASSAGRRRWDPLALPGDSNADSSGRHTTIDQRYLLHDWLAEARSLPPCKAEQLRSIVALTLYHPMLGHGLAFDTLNPLASQPIVELALRTPTYQFIEGGSDRSLQRAAFTDPLPPEVVRRTHKGFINHRLQSDVAQLTGELREFLLEGHLLASGHVDRSRVELLLSDNYPINDAELDALFTMLAAEAWLISWRARA